MHIARAKQMLCRLCLVVLAGCPLAVAADYPNNMPILGLSDVQSDLAAVIQLHAGQQVRVVGSFSGTHTGCGVYIHELGDGKLVDYRDHTLNSAPDRFTAILQAPKTGPDAFVISGWTFIGGPPHVALPPGWDQMPPASPTYATIPGEATFICQGSTYGPTVLSIRIEPM
jgi:hypothetical protein